MTQKKFKYTFSQILFILLFIAVGVFFMGFLIGVSTNNPKMIMQFSSKADNDVTPAPENKTIYVCPNSDDSRNQIYQYPSSDCKYEGGKGVQDAIDLAYQTKNDAIIHLRAGYYSRQDTSPMKFFGREIPDNCFAVLNGVDEKNILKETKDHRPLALTIEGEGNDKTILDGVKSIAMAGICIQYTNAKIQKLGMTGFDKNNLTGIKIYKSESTQLSSLSLDRSEIRISNSASILIDSLLIRNNEFAAIGINDSDLLTITNTYIENSKDQAIRASDTSMVLSGVNLVNQKNGIDAGISKNPTGKYFRIANSKIVNSSEKVIYLQAYPRVYLSNNYITNSHLLPVFIFGSEFIQAINNTIYKLEGSSIQISQGISSKTSPSVQLINNIFAYSTKSYPTQKVYGIRILNNYIEGDLEKEDYEKFYFANNIFLYDEGRCADYKSWCTRNNSWDNNPPIAPKIEDPNNVQPVLGLGIKYPDGSPTDIGYGGRIYDPEAKLNISTDN